MTSGLKISSSAVVCEEAKLVGDITIGARTVVHPKARIIAEAGPIIIGDNNLIEEQAQIINRRTAGPDGSPTNPNQTVMIIGNNNVFEVGSYSESLKVGDHNILEGKCRVGRQTILSNGCIIGAMCDLCTTEELPENTVIYGAKCQRRVQQERPAPQTLQLDFLSKILPNYHHLIKPHKGSK